MATIEKLLSELTAKLQQAHGSHLVSVILYGSAAGGDHHGAYSDLNVFCVLDEVTPAALEDSEPVFRWWRAQQQPAPLLMSVEETRASTDCFPIEFMDMRERRKVLYGADVIEGLVIDEIFYRAQVEHELRAKLLRLRQKAAGVAGNDGLLARLMTDSVATFCVLARHALRLAGAEAPWSKRRIVQECAATFQIDATPFEVLLDVREGRKQPRQMDAAEVFGAYLRSITSLVKAVDRLER
jgi:hypothetical protein